MSNIDQFESVFRSATRELFEFEKISFKKILLVTDLDDAQTAAFKEQCQKFLEVLASEFVWVTLSGDDSKRPSTVVKAVSEQDVDLVVTYRNLHSEHDRQIYSLGTHVDMLTQKTPVPVLLMPHPDTEEYDPTKFVNTDVTMAITDHMNGDSSLVNMAVAFTKENGKLFLTHVEDEKTFEYYMEAISQIPEMDTDVTRELLRKRLLKDPAAYIEVCSKELKEASVAVNVEALVSFGRHLSTYREAIESHKVDLLIMHAKDEDQLAMHGIAYPLAVEFRHLPLLMA